LLIKYKLIKKLLLWSKAAGGAALTAYARLQQFEDMSYYERTEFKKALSKYCELDTMAMVMIYEGKTC
jgi:hypothetical protein